MLLGELGASLGTSVSVGLGVTSMGAAAPVGQAPSEAVRQATVALLVAQLQVVTGQQSVYMMYPGPAVNGVVGWGSSGDGWWACAGWCGSAFGSHVGSRAWAQSGAWACWSGGECLSSPALGFERGCLGGGDLSLGV